MKKFVNIFVSLLLSQLDLVISSEHELPSQHLATLYERAGLHTVSSLSDLHYLHSRTPPQTPEDKTLNAPQLYASEYEFNVANYVSAIYSHWGALTSAYVLQRLVDATQTPLFQLSDDSTLTHALGAFHLFNLLENNDGAYQLTNFISSNLLTGQMKCESDLPMMEFAAQMRKLEKFALHRTEVEEWTNPKVLVLQQCLKQATDEILASSYSADTLFDACSNASSDSCRSSVTHDVVIAQGRNEDLSWVSGIHPRNSNSCVDQLSCSDGDKTWEPLLNPLPSLSEIGVNPIIYSKGIHNNENEHTRLPYNVGGEAVTYLYHIITHYDSLADVTTFLQGEPIAGAKDATVHFNSLSELHEKILSASPTKRFDPISNLILQNDWRTGAPFDEIKLGTGQLDLYEWITKQPAPPTTSNLWWHACGMFSASKAAIRSRPKYFYEDLYTMLTDSYVGNLKYPMDLSPKGVLFPVCNEDKRSLSLYCTEYQLHVLFYVVERMWQYILDDNNPIWHLDICGDGHLSSHFQTTSDHTAKFWHQLCSNSSVRENGWLVPFLQKYASSISESSHLHSPQLELSLLQPTDRSIVLTKELQLIPMIKVASESELFDGFEAQGDTKLCFTIDGMENSEPSCDSYQTHHRTIVNSELDSGSHVLKVWLENWSNLSSSSVTRPISSNVVSVRFLMMASKASFGTDILNHPKLREFLLAHPYHQTSLIPEDAVLSFFPGHDSSIAVIKDGVVLASLELERLFNIRYMAGWGTGSVGSPLDSPPTEIWREAIEAILEFCNMSNRTFKFGAIVPMEFGEVHNAAVSAIKLIAPVDHWLVVDHHLSHANLVLHDLYWGTESDKNNFIFTLDGGGNDGYLHAYVGNKKSGLRELKSWNINLGVAYMRVSGLISEVTGSRVCKELVPCALGLPGKLMGYVALGMTRSEWEQPIFDFLTMNGNDHNTNRDPNKGLYYDPSVLPGWKTFSDEDIENSKGGDGEDIGEKILQERDLSNTLQTVFEKVFMSVIVETISLAESRGINIESIEGIGLSGGCSLNVLLNSEIQRVFPSWKVHVPAAPGDNGLAIGAAWMISPPTQKQQQKPQQLQFIGLPPFDLHLLESLSVQYSAKRVTGVAEIVTLLSENKILGVIRGRQEFGPRALGHRSLLAVPTRGMKDRMNKLKKREFFRPVAPMVAAEIAAEFFDEEGISVESPYMSFAPRIRRNFTELVPAVTHYDRSCRPQTVSEFDEEWVHALLWGVANKMNTPPVLINTSFNTNGKPIINSLVEALYLLKTEPELDYVLIEDRLFSKANVMA